MSYRCHMLFAKYESVIQNNCKLHCQVGRMGMCPSADPLRMSLSHCVNENLFVIFIIFFFSYLLFFSFFLSFLPFPFFFLSCLFLFFPFFLHEKRKKKQQKKKTLKTEFAFYETENGYFKNGKSEGLIEFIIKTLEYRNYVYNNIWVYSQTINECTVLC